MKIVSSRLNVIPTIVIFIILNTFVWLMSWIGLIILSYLSKVDYGSIYFLPLANVMSAALIGGGAMKAMRHFTKRNVRLFFENIASAVILITFYVHFTEYRLGVKVGGVGNEIDAILVFSIGYIVLAVIFFLISHAEEKSE